MDARAGEENREARPPDVGMVRELEARVDLHSEEGASGESSALYPAGASDAGVETSREIAETPEGDSRVGTGYATARGGEIDYMSYCRWSSDHFECDVYVYADVDGGWTTHVAGRRRKTKLPDEIKALFEIELSNPNFAQKLVAAYRAEQQWEESQPCEEYDVQIWEDGTQKPGKHRTLKDSEYIDLSTVGPEAGQSYSDPSPGACANRLEGLRAKGFNVPQYAIDELRKEQAAGYDDEPCASN